MKNMARPDWERDPRLDLSKSEQVQLLIGIPLVTALIYGFLVVVLGMGPR